MPSTLVARGMIAALVAVVPAAAPAPRLPAHAAPPPTVAVLPARSPHRTPADRPSAAELDQRIVAAARRLEVIVERFNESREDLDATLARRRTLGAQLIPMTADLRRRQELIGGLVTRTYQRTRSGPAVALFGSDDPHRFVDRLLVLHQLAAEEQRAVAELGATRARVDDTRRALDLLAARQRRQQAQLNTRKAMLEGEIAALRQMRLAAYGGGSRYSDAMEYPTPPHVPGSAGQVVAFAFAQLGKPYRWGSAGPGSYDCSGLTLAAWETAGVRLPHNAARQYRAMAHIGRDRLRPGDLIFYYRPISHVGVYVGDGRMIHAPEYGEDVRVAPIDSLPVRGFGRPRAS